MRIVFIALAATFLVLALWRGVDAQEEATGPCWTVEHGPIGFQTVGRISNASESAAPETWEAVLVNKCTGDTWKRRSYRGRMGVDPPVSLHDQLPVDPPWRGSALLSPLPIPERPAAAVRSPKGANGPARSLLRGIKWVSIASC